MHIEVNELIMASFAQMLSEREPSWRSKNRQANSESVGFDCRLIYCRHQGPRDQLRINVLPSARSASHQKDVECRRVVQRDRGNRQQRHGSYDCNILETVHSCPFGRVFE